MRLHLSSLAIFTTSIASAASLCSDRLGVQGNPTGAFDGSADRQLGMAQMKKSVQELVNGGPVAPEVAKTLQEVLEKSLKVAVLSAKTALQKELSEHYASGYDGCDTALAAPLIWVVPSTRPAARPRLHLRLPWTPVQRRWLASSLPRKVLAR